MERVTLSRMQNPVRGFLHGGAALASALGVLALLHRARSRPGSLPGAIVFGLALPAMYTVSSLYHSVPWSQAWKLRLQRLDHSMIYLVVAGTFTPIAVAALDGTTLTLGLASIWSMATGGILLKAVSREPRTGLSVGLQLAMGWLAVVWLPQFYQRLGLWAVGLIALGGLCYTLGAVVLSTRRPGLYPRSFSYHELFHLLVVAGSAPHFAAVLLYAIPATG